MTEFLAILATAALVNNIVLIQFLGVSAFFSNSNRIESAATVGLLTAVVLILSALINYVVFQFILIPLGLEFLQLLCFVSSSALLTTAILQWLAKYSPRTLRRQQSAVLVIAANSAVIGSTLLIIKASYTLLEALAYSLGSALGFAALLILFAALQERLQTADTPLAFRGLAVELLCAGLAAVSLLGFVGMFNS